MCQTALDLGILSVGCVPAGLKILSQRGYTYEAYVCKCKFYNLKKLEYHRLAFAQADKAG